MVNYLIPRAVHTSEDVESMRIVRNSCREFMTNDQRWISPEQQVEWWKRWNRTFQWRRGIHAYVYEVAEHILVDEKLLEVPTIVGYGLLRRIGGSWWCSGGLVPSHRGKGLGKGVFGHLIEACPTNELMLDVFKTNEPAVKLYHSLGFEDVGFKTNDHGESIIVMRKVRQ